MQKSLEASPSGAATRAALEWPVTMIRPRYTIAWSMIAIAVIGYFCAFPELAVLLGIFASAVLFVSPVALVIFLACRSSFPGNAGESPALSQSAEPVADADADAEPGRDQPGPSGLPPVHRSFGLAGSA
jgi:hypothetical protein